jgi:uncharacterized protein (DUF169 family)
MENIYVQLGFKTQFLKRWQKYFPGAELPLAFFYTDDVTVASPFPESKAWRCVICDLARARKGKPVLFDVDAIGCSGGQRYFGFKYKLRPYFEYFLSCGLPGKVKGERYKKSPELVRKSMENQPPFSAPGKYIVFKRWDHLEEADQPLGVIFFATADELSGLFTLANYEESDRNGVVAPFGSGCSAIVYYPYLETLSDRPRAILGMFDVSARPCVQGLELTFTVPWKKFVRMVDNMDESFLIGDSWKKVKSRIKRHHVKR